MSLPPDPSTDTDGGLDWLLSSFVRRVPDVAHAIAVSVDGLTLATSAGLPKDRSDHLSAITSGLASLTIGAAKVLAAGRVRQTVVDMDGGILLVMSVGDRAQLAVLGAAGCDLAQVGYEAALLAHRVATALEPGARVAGQL